MVNVCHIASFILEKLVLVMVKSTFKNDMAGDQACIVTLQMFKNKDFLKSKIGNSLSRKLLIDLETQGEMYL